MGSQLSTESTHQPFNHGMDKATKLHPIINTQVEHQLLIQIHCRGGQKIKPNEKKQMEP